MKSDDAPKQVMPTSLPFQVFDFLYFRPSVAKEAKYFEGEGLSVELVRVGGSTRIVAARWAAVLNSFMPANPQ